MRREREFGACFGADVAERLAGCGFDSYSSLIVENNDV